MERSCPLSGFEPLRVKGRCRNREVYEMKKSIKKITVVLLCLTLVLSISACGGETPDQGSDVNNTNAAVSEEELNLIGGSLSFVREENRLVYLLDRYENIHIVSQFTDGAEDQSVCFLFDGQPAWASVEYSETSRRVLSGWLGSLYFYCEPGKVSGELDMEMYKSQSQSQESDSLDYMISSYISEDAQVEKVEDLEPYLRVTAVNGDQKDPEARRDVYILDKGTLRLVEVFYMNENGVSVGGHSIEPGWDENGLISNFLTAWEETRTVTFVYDKLLSNGKTSTETVAVEVPATWEVLPRYTEETYCYMDSNLTKSYEYPGDGTEDYTVYVTNTAG